MHHLNPLRKQALVSIAAMIVMLICYGLTAAGMMGPNPVGQGDTYTAPLIVPAGYAFAIWSVIYLSLMIWPIYRYIKLPKYHLMWISFHRWYAANVVANGLWLVAASFDYQILTVGIIVFMLLTLYKINAALRVLDPLERTSYWVDHFGFSLYFGWITLATALNITSALAFYEWSGWGLSELHWSLIILPTAILIAGYISWKFQDLTYAVVPIWALVAIIVKRINDLPILAYLAIALTVLCALLWFYLFYRSRFLNNS